MVNLRATYQTIAAHTGCMLLLDDAVSVNRFQTIGTKTLQRKAIL